MGSIHVGNPGGAAGGTPPLAAMPGSHPDCTRQPDPSSGHDAILAQLRLLRTQAHPLPWPAVAQALGLTGRTLRRYRWLAAAMLVAGGAGWTDAARDPAVDFNPDTLRKQHAKAKLPGGLSWADYVGQYQSALRSRTAELQQERGVEAAELLQSIGIRALQFAKRMQDLLEDYAAHPAHELALGPKHTISTTERGTQMTILFPGEFERETDDGPPRDRLAAPYARYLMAFEAQAVALAANAAKIAQGKTDVDYRNEDAPATSSEGLEEQLAKAEALTEDLRRYAEQRPEAEPRLEAQA